MNQTAPPSASVLAFCSFFLVSSILATSERQLHVLSEVVSGPARGRPLALHLDTTVPENVRWAILGVEAIHRTPHLTIDHSRRQSELIGGTSSSSYATMLHVVLFFTPRSELLQTLWVHWKPRNLLLLSLGPSLGTDLLRHEALSGVEKVALIGHLLAREEPHPDVLGVYTLLPFSSNDVRFLGRWRQENFATWEALFPSRFPSFEGYTFHIASRFIGAPFFYQNRINPKEGQGVSAEMLKVMCKKLNFTYTTTNDSVDSKWGGFSKGSWNGILGMVQRGEKNLTINFLALDINRAQYFDFSTTLIVDGFGAFMMNPPPLPRWMSIARVFGGNIWLAVLFTLVATTCFTLLQVRRFQVDPRHHFANHIRGSHLLQVDLLLASKDELLN